MITFTEEKSKKRAADLIDLIESDYDAHSRRSSKIQKVRALYYGEINRPLRYDGQPNAHLPVVAEKIEGMVPKEMNAFWAAEPHATVRRVGAEFNEEDTRANESFLNWAVESDIPDFYQTFETVVRNKYIDGTSIAKIWYNYQTRKTLLRVPVKHSWRGGQVDFVGAPVPKDRLKLPIELVMEALESARVFRYGSGWEETEVLDDLYGRQLLCDFVDSDQRLYEGVQIEFVKSQFIDEIDVYVHRRIVVCDNVEVDAIPFEDIIAPYHTRNLQEAPRIAHKYGLTIPEIQQRIREDGWDISEEELDTLQGKARVWDKEEQLDNQRRNLRNLEDKIVGEMPTQTGRYIIGEPYSDNKILMLEVYCRDDVDGDGEWEEVIYHIAYGLDKIVKAYYLEEVFPHGRRPFAEFHCIPLTNNWYSMSLAEYLAPINIEVDACVNLVQEAQEVINNPWFGFVPTALGAEPEKALSLKPGQGIELLSPDGLVFPSFPQQPLANLQLVDSLLLFADRLTLSPQSVGSSQVRNAPRTARGTLALLSEGGIKIDSFIMAAQKGGWREMMQQIHALYGHYGTDEKKFWVTKNANPRKISRKALQGRFEYTFTGNSVNTNREVTRTIALQRAQILLADPLYQMDLNARLAVIHDVLRHLDEGTDIEKLMPRLPQGGGTHLPYSQDTENQMMMQLIPVEVLPTDDDAAHLKRIWEFQNSQVFEQLQPATVAMIATHAAVHARALVAKQSQPAMTPQGATQANNVPVELGDMEGGLV